MSFNKKKNKAVGNKEIENIIKFPKMTPLLDLNEALKKEKKKLHVPENKIVFVATADIASMYWCDQQMIFRIKQHEPTIYSAYLEDIKREGNLTEKELIDKIAELGKIYEMEKEIEKKSTLMTRKWIIKGIFFKKDKIPPSFNLSDLISKNDLEVLDNCKNELELLAEFGEILDKIKLKLKLAKGSLFDSYTAYPRVDNGLVDILASKSNANPAMRRGIEDEMSFSEQYPTFRYHFNWKDYIVEGAPDGIGPDFCYEFKSTAKWYMVPFIKPVAEAQVQLYSYFYKKPKTKIEIYVSEAAKKLTYDGKADEKRAVQILERMDRLLKGKEKPIPPKEWKCRKCNYASECKIAK